MSLWLLPKIAENNHFDFQNIWIKTQNLVTLKCLTKNFNIFLQAEKYGYFGQFVVILAYKKGLKTDVFKPVAEV